MKKLVLALMAAVVLAGCGGGQDLSEEAVKQTCRDAWIDQGGEPDDLWPREWSYSPPEDGWASAGWLEFEPNKVGYGCAVSEDGQVIIQSSS